MQISPQVDSRDVLFRAGKRLETSRVTSTGGRCKCAVLLCAHLADERAYAWVATAITPHEKEMPAWSRASRRDSCGSSFRRRTGDFSLDEIVELLLPLEKKKRKELETCSSGNLSVPDVGIVKEASGVLDVGIVSVTLAG